MGRDVAWGMQYLFIRVREVVHAPCRGNDGGDQVAGQCCGYATADRVKRAFAAIMPPTLQPVTAPRRPLERLAILAHGE